MNWARVIVLYEPLVPLQEKVRPMQLVNFTDTHRLTQVVGLNTMLVLIDITHFIQVVHLP
jgi:hypothetical protein